jgi:putative ABC transport system permease protein
MRRDEPIHGAPGRRRSWLRRAQADLRQDVRYGLRMLGKSPGFTAVAILTLAAGIGANTAIFSVVDAILLKPLPYPHADRLVLLWSSFGNEHRAPAAAYDFDQIRRHSRYLEQAGGIWVTNGTVTGTDDLHPEAVKLARVTDGFLPLFCGGPLLGRLFTAQDVTPQGSTATVISYGLWQRRFGADAGVVGKRCISTGIC